MTANANPPRFDLPQPDEAEQPFWDACKEGRLVLKRCANGHVFHYPRPFCPTCWTEDVEWIEASGTGTLYTYSVVHTNDLPPWPSRVPYVAAVVELTEGPKIMTNVVDVDFDALEVGMPLQVVFHETSEEFTIPVFRPAAG